MTTELVVTPTPTPEQAILIETIRQEIELGKERAIGAMNHETKITYWNVGQHIKIHLLENKDRAGYGDELYPILSQNLSIDKSTLYRSVQLFELYPNILATKRELTWSHLKVLLAIPEEAVRRAYEEEVIQKRLSVEKLKILIKGQNSDTGNALPPILKVTRTAPYVYRMKQRQNVDMVDAGFNLYFEKPARKARGILKFKIGETPHYTYKATVTEIVDGDTVWMDVIHGFKGVANMKLRLRGIDCAEINTPEGQAAKDYVTACLAPCPFVAIKTYWQDKFARYLTDIFYDPNETDLLKVIKNGKFLNQELLDKGYAVKY